MTTLEAIALIELDMSNVQLILDRILDLSVLDHEDVLFSLDEDESKSFYERIIINQKLAKPSEARVQEELDEYKNELAVAEQARLDEIARVENIKSRFSAIDVRGAIHKLGLDIMNPALELNRIIDEDDQARLAELETAAGQFESEQSEIRSREEIKADGKVARKMCEEVLDLITGFNLRRSLTKEQIDTMESTFEVAAGYLRAGRPDSAKAAIEAINPDGVIVTAEMKSAALAELVL